MKKSLSMIAAALLSASLLAACGGQPSQTQQAAEDAAAAEQNTAAGEETTENTPNEDGKDTTAPADEAESAETESGETESGEAQDAADMPLTDESIGAVSFLPSGEDLPLVYGNDKLHAYFKRQNVIPGGRMTVKKVSDDSVVEEIDLTDKSRCTVGEQDSTFDLLGWNGGTHLVIQLKSMPAPSESYYVTLEEGAFMSQDGSIASKEVTDSSVWQFDVARYGIALATPNGSDVYVDDVLSADIIIQGEAVKAEISNYDENRVRFNEKEFKESGKLEIKIYQIGEDSFTVTYYNAEDDPIGAITVSYTASVKPEPQEEAPKKAVTNL